VAEVLHQFGGGSVLEVGPGTGALAVALLQELTALDELPDRYFLLETSPELTARQQKTLAPRLGDYQSRVHWLNQLPTNFSGVVLVNEMLDALPVTRFRVESGKALEAYVQTGEQGFDWCWQGAAPNSPATAIIEQHCLPEGYSSECAPRAAAWVRAVAESLQQGLLLIIDYGYSAAEYYHPDRITGTLMCHYRHRAHSNPFHLPGLQDITAHVDFSALATAGRSAGLELAGFSNQEAFLLALGVTDLAEVGCDTEARARISQEVQQLVFPSGMGERFKVLALAKGIEGPLKGFTLRDRSTQL
jgi:SAM-dependent MidA family methyltransferase